MRKVKLWLFKPSGKWYTEETIEVDEALQVFEIVNYVQNKIHVYTGMHCVIPFDDCEDINGYPCMIPAEERTKKTEISLNSREPLTLEQLQAMNGQPIYAVPLGHIPARKPYWLIVDLSTPQFFLHYGETWIAYSSQPEEYQ